MKNIWAVLSICVLLAGCSLEVSQTQSKEQPKLKNDHSSKVTSSSFAAKSGRWATVTRVIDGDTLEIDGGEKIRLIGVNTPETVKPKTPVQPYGKAASDFTKSQLQGKKVYVELDVQPKDRYGRTLAYIFLREPQTEQEVETYMFNATLVREGYAQLMTIPPNVKYADLFVKLQRQAREANKGLWSLGIYKDSTTSTNHVYKESK